MFNNNYLILILLVSVLVSAGFSNAKAASNGTYLITGYKYFRPKSTYLLTVSWVGSSVPLNVNAELKSKNGLYSVSGAKKVLNGDTSGIKLKIGEWPYDSYILSINGSSNNSTTIFETIDILFVNKKMSAFIQMDKSIYKPNQKVNYRIIVVDADLKPVTVFNATLTIKDAQSNIIKFEKGIKVSNGIYQGFMQLSDRPVYGDWRLKVQISDIQVYKTFTVDEYVLPKFEIVVIPPKSVTFSDVKFTAIIQAKYTYQKPLAGNVKVRAKFNEYCYSNRCETDEQIATLDDNGKASVTFNMDEIVQLRSYYSGLEIKITAIVEEGKTGKTQSQSAIFRITSQSQSIVMSVTPITYKPGLPITLTLQLKDETGGPLKNPNPDTITVDIENFTTFANLSSYGMALISYTVPSTTNGTLFIRANYNCISGSIYVPQADAQLSNYININIISGSTNVGMIQKFEVTSTFMMRKVYYEVIGRGIILESKVQEVKSDTKNIEIGVKITHDMTPSAVILCYVINTDGEIVADILEFSSSGFFLTPVNLVATPDDVTPNSSVLISVKTNPKALVCLSAIDQSLLLLKSGHDVSEAEIISDIKDYNGYNGPYYNNFNEFYISYGNLSRVVRITYMLMALFQKAKLFYFTNSPYETSKQYFNYYHDTNGMLYGMELDNMNGAGLDGETMLPFQNYEEGMETMAQSETEASLMSLDANSPIPIRSNFPETWIWTEVVAGNDGTAQYNAFAPDTITSWVLNAFAMDKKTGFAMSQTQPKVRVFRPFFISLNLPYSIIRGEILTLQAVVFNYGNNDITADVTMNNNDGDFVFKDQANNQTFRKSTVQIKAGKSASVEFFVSGTKLGHAIVLISAIAKSGTTGDIVKQTLLVKSEGKPVYFNRPVLIELENSKLFNLVVDIDIPKIAVEDSQYIEIFAIGDIMGPTLNNLDQLLQMPYGCGEQNMVTLIPNIVVIIYLETVNRVTPAIKEKALKFMEAGYQRELTFKHDDNSFSAFGKRDHSGSSMLTAFVVKTFHQAKKFIDVSEDILRLGLQFLTIIQNSDGSFNEPGQVWNQQLKTGISGQVALTAYILIAFQTVNDSKFSSNTQSAVSYLEEHVSNTTDKYTLCLLAYALVLSNSSKSVDVFNKVKQSLTTKGSQSYVKVSEPRSDVSQYCYYGTPTLNVEATAYALLTFIEMKEIASGIPLLRWLTDQRNANGGFTSTQDTAIGLEALAKMASAVYSSASSSVEVMFSYPNAKKPIIKTITKSNSIVLQSDMIPKYVRQLNITAKGNGIALAQVAWSYNVLNEDSKNKIFFNLVIQVNKTINGYKLKVCTSVPSSNPSGMAIVEVTLPSGYEFEPFENSQNIPSIKRVEMNDPKTIMNVYFDSITGKETCFNVEGTLKVSVLNLKNTTVTVYDYYKPENRLTVPYSP